MRLVVVAIACSLMAAGGQDPRFAALQKTLLALKWHAGDTNNRVRGARPELTVAKHQLRDWIESQLDAVKADGQVSNVSAQINDVLKQRAETPRAGDPENLLGSVGEVKMYLNSELLIVTSGLGIICGYDESAYAYRATRRRWERVWQSEQSDYTEGKY